MAALAILVLPVRTLGALGPLHVVHLQELETAPILAVGTIEHIDKKMLLPPPQSQGQTPARYWEMTLRVHRAYSKSSETTLSRGTPVQVRYVSYADAGPGGVPGGIAGPPIWPLFETGQTGLFALAPGEGSTLRLVAEEGLNLTVPAIVSPAPTTGVTDGRGYILAELANTLANGEAASRYDAALYLFRLDTWPREFRDVLGRAIGNSEEQWLEAGCAVLATFGIPRTPLRVFMTGAQTAGDSASATREQNLRWILAKGAERDFPDRLIRCMLRNLSGYEWGATKTLIEFKDSPIVIREVRRSLMRDPDGWIGLASALVRNGQQTFLREALEAAVKLVSDPGGVNSHDLQPAAALLRDFGTEPQFDAVVTSLRRLEFVNEQAFRKLVDAVRDMRSQRDLRVDEVLIDDRRPYGMGRYCDTAAAEAQKLSGKDFGVSQAITLEERDKAVAKAAAWLRRQ